VKKLVVLISLTSLFTTVKPVSAQLNYGMCGLVLPSEISLQMSNIKGVPTREECNIHYNNSRKPKVNPSDSILRKVEHNQPIQKPSINLEMDFGKGNYVYQDTQITAKATTNIPNDTIQESMLIIMNSKVHETVDMKPGTKIWFRLDKMFEYHTEIDFVFAIQTKDGVIHKSEIFTINNYQAEMSIQLEQSAKVLNPLNPKNWPGQLLILGFTTADFFTEDFYKCKGEDKNLLGHDISSDNQALGCGFALTSVVPVGKVVKIGKSLDGTNDFFKVVRHFKKNGKDLVEVTPLTGKALQSAKNADELAQLEKATSITKALPYLDNSTEITLDGTKYIVQRKFASDSKWLAHFTKHGYELNVKTHQDYMQKAFELSTQETTIDLLRKTKTKKGVEYIYSYKISTNEFSVVKAKTGEMLSYFPPEKGTYYYFAQ
jgi:hypothetical protein